MQGSTCNFLEGLCVITEGFWIQEKERCSVITGNDVGSTLGIPVGP